MKYMTKEWYDLMQVAGMHPFDKTLREKAEFVIREYCAEYRRMFPSPPYFMRTIKKLHDFSIISAGLIDNDYVIHIEDEDKELEGNKIVLKNAVVKKQDFDKQELGWCYEELYPTKKGYELHILFFEYGTSETYDLIVECDNIEITNNK